MNDPSGNSTVNKLLSMVGVAGESHSRIKIGGGIIGRLSWLIGVVVVFIGLIAIKSDSVWIQGGAITVIALLATLFIPRLLKIVEDHPETAVMEGSEILAHRHLQIGMKGNPIIDDPGPETEDIDLPPPKQILNADVPDSESSGPKLFDQEVDQNG